MNAKIRLFIISLMINFFPCLGALLDSFEPQQEIVDLYETKVGSSLKNLNQQAMAEPAETIGNSPKVGQASLENTFPFSKVFSLNDSTRYKSIKLSVDSAEQEVDFWARQMSEHALFLHLGLEDKNLKREALIVHNKLENVRSRFNKNPRNMRTMNQLLPLLEKERNLQMRIVTLLEEGKWVGWLYPAFLNHITLELDYVVDKLNGIQYSPEEELSFWNRINGDHAITTSHLLEPSELDNVKKSADTAMEFNAIPKTEKDVMLRLSLHATKELDAFNKKAKIKGPNIKSIIHPVLLDHIIREGERSIQTLQSLNLNKEAEVLRHKHQADLLQYQMLEEE